MKYLKYTLYMVLLAVMGIACKVDSSKFPVDTGKVINKNNSGGILRIINSETTGATWNILKLDSQKYVLTFEADDIENGGQLESVDFYVGYQNNPVVNDSSLDRPVSKEPIRTLKADQFTKSEDSGLPRITTTFTSEELFKALDLKKSDIIVGSTILLRWTLHLTNGKSFNDANSSGNVKGAPFYNSPFATNITQAVGVDQDKFVGKYTLKQDAQGGNPGVTGAGNGWLFGSSGSGTVELKVDPTNPLNGRVFTPYGGYAVGLGFGTKVDDIHFAFTINPLNNQNYTIMTKSSGTGLQCDSGISLGAPKDISKEGSWDDSSDKEFHLTITEDITNDCGAGPTPITFTLTKK